MEVKKDNGRELLKELSRYLIVDKCMACECLHAALMQLRLEHPELAGGINRFAEEKLHSCLGCDPCPPRRSMEKVRHIIPAPTGGHEEGDTSPFRCHQGP